MEMAYCYEHAISWSTWLEDWSAEDRARIVAFALEKAERCQMCGTAEWEWRANQYAYEPVRHICFGCQKKDLAREDEDGHTPGLSIILIPGDEAAKIRALQASKER